MDLRSLRDQMARAIEGPDGPRIAFTLRGYRPEQLSGDVIAGLTVAALIVPLSIGYAGVAGLPPEVGLYASMAPLVAYAVFGSGRRLIVGPDASTAALIGASIIPLAAAGDDRMRLAGVLGLMVAAIFVAMRMARMGFLADFLSRPILLGYMTGVGITVAFGQVQKILGGPAITSALEVLGRVDLSTASAGAVLDAMLIAIRGSGVDAISAVIGIGAVAAILLGRRLVPRLPMALIVMVGAMVLSAALDLQARGVAVLGPVTPGLPLPRIPLAAPTELIALLPGALGLAVLSFADTAATGRTFASLRGERTDANRELVALAAADAAGALTGGYPVSSSPSRTAAAEQGGSSSQLTGLVAATAVAVVLVLLTGPLSYLPSPALGGVILVSALSLIDLRSIRSIARLKASEGAIAAITMASVIVYGTLQGVVIAVLLASLNIVRRATWPQIVEEVHLADGNWRDGRRRRDGHRVAGVIVVRTTGPLFFANATALETRVRALVDRRPTTKGVVIDLAAVSDIDITAGETLRQLAADLARGGRRLVVARPLGPVRDELRAYGLADLMAATGGSHGSVDEAIAGLGLELIPEAADIFDAADVAVPAPTPGAATPGNGAATPPGRPVEDRTVRRVVIGSVGIIVAAVVLGWGLAALGNLRDTPSVVPNLVGLQLDRASTAATDAGFVLLSPDYVRSDARPAGIVLGQDPAAGSGAEPGSGIRPVVSAGSTLVAVPEVTGLPEGQAIAQLTGSGLSVRRSESAYDPEIPTGAVIVTSPPAGTSVGSGTVVSYTVSLGPEPPQTPTSAPPTRPAPSAAPTPSPADTPPTTAGPTAAPTEGPILTPGPTAEPSRSTGPPSPDASPSPLVEPSTAPAPAGSTTP